MHPYKNKNNLIKISMDYLHVIFTNIDYLQ